MKTILCLFKPFRRHPSMRGVSVRDVAERAVVRMFSRGNVLLSAGRYCAAEDAKILKERAYACKF